MVDRHYSETVLAKLYDACCAGREDFGFYLPLVMAAGSVLDVGCGTGELLRKAHAAGHAGRLVGLDPAAAMLEVARRQTDVEWILGDLSSVGWNAEFDLIVMTGHAFQVLTDDQQIAHAFARVRAVLGSGGRFVFETRNPLAREWETWDRKYSVSLDGDGVPIQVTCRVETGLVNGLLTFTQHYASPAWDREEVSRSALRFLDPDSLAAFLDDAGLRVEQQFGDWDREPLTETSPEIITIVSRA